MKTHRAFALLQVIAILGFLPQMARSQSYSTAPLPASPGTAAPQPVLTYTPPTERAKARNYFLEGFGPFPIAGAAFAAGISQFTNSPPEWKQGAEGYGKRFGSDFGMDVVGATSRYALSEALHEDMLYYHCECKGVLPRTRHAMFSAVTARHGSDGHRVLSFSAILAPYVASTTAVYGWYPDRYGAKDAFRMGNYTLLTSAGTKIAIEFLTGGPHSLLSRMHLGHAFGSADQEQDH